MAMQELNIIILVLVILCNWVCLFLVNVCRLYFKQPHSSGNLTGKYAQELQERYEPKLGNLSNIGYTDFWIIKVQDMRVPFVWYMLGQALILWIFYDLLTNAA